MAKNDKNIKSLVLPGPQVSIEMSDKVPNADLNIYIGKKKQINMLDACEVKYNDKTELRFWIPEDTYDFISYGYYTNTFRIIGTYIMHYLKDKDIPGSINVKCDSPYVGKSVITEMCINMTFKEYSDTHINGYFSSPSKKKDKKKNKKKGKKKK